MAKETSKKRRINSTSNLSSLLNLPSFMHQFGPPRLYWEGGFKGEGILRSVKPVVTQGVHMSWFATAALQKFYYDKSMNMLLEASEDVSESSLNSYSDRKFYCYKNGKDHIKKDIEGGKPISAALCNLTQQTYCLAIIHKKKMLTRISFHDCEGIFLGSTYHTFISLDSTDPLLISSWHQYTPVLLLPNRGIFPNCTSIPQYFYYCISDQWLERRPVGNNTIAFELPRIDGANY